MERVLQHKLILVTIAIQLVALPFVLFAVKQQQETRSQASGNSTYTPIPIEPTTTLSFNPNSTLTTPHSVKVGQEFPVEVIIEPNENLVSLAKLEINYDPSKLILSKENPTIVEPTAFPETIEGPVYTNGKIQLVVSTGFDRTRVIRAKTKIMTINFKAKSAVNQTQITFGTNSSVYSIGSDDSASDNVLSNSTPATIKIN